MSFLDDFSRQLSNKIDWVKFEAEKLQRVTALQGELNELRRQLDARRFEFGDRAMDLYRAGKIQSPTLGELMRSIEAIQASITLKEEEVKSAQSVARPPEATTAPPPAQSVPVTVEPPRAAPVPAEPPVSATDTKPCLNCGFQMPATSQFCPSCGNRVAA
ncbi:MAG TPA: zinc ribbon domain-containing protein [Roseiflexaceae bacterium]|nr:zinc ribbon domain-containing protein [Roseiflexaceae bacterium]